MNPNINLDSIIPVLIRIWRKKNGFTDPKLPKNKLTLNELSRIGNSLKKLSKGLTEDRLFIGEKYLDNNEFLGSYLLYFWIKSYVQAGYCLDKIPLTGLESVLDLGGGPGPIAMALYDAGIKNITTIDNSIKALAISKEIFSTDAARKAVKIINHDLTKMDELPIKTLYDFSIIGHALNELWPDDQNKINLRTKFIEELFINKIKSEGFLIIIEPALPDIIHDLISVRDRISDKGYRIIYPCIDIKNCPVLNENNSTCHQEIKWKPPAAISRIAGIAGFHINPLPVGLIVIGNKNYVNNSNLPEKDEFYRVVSQRMLSKNGKYRYIICGKDGRITISAKKDENLSSYKYFINLHKGDIISFKNCQKTDKGFILIPETILTVINNR